MHVGLRAVDMEGVTGSHWGHCCDTLSSVFKCSIVSELTLSQAVLAIVIASMRVNKGYAGKVP